MLVGFWVLMKWKILHQEGTASVSLCCQRGNIRQGTDIWSAKMGKYGMRNMRTLDYNRLGGRDRFWRRKEDEIAKIQIARSRYNSL